MFCCAALYYVGLYCLYGLVLYCIVWCAIVVCIVLCSLVLHCIVSNGFVLSCIALYGSAVHWFVMISVIWYVVVLYCVF